MKYLKFKNLSIVYTEKTDGNQRLEKNRKKTANKFNFNKIYIPNQKHTNQITYYKNTNDKADGIFTDKKQIPIGVITADCMPIVLFDDNILSVIHAGWRGLLSGIIQNSLRNHNTDRLRAFILPSIRQCCYEVQKDFIKEHNIEKKYFSIRENRIYLNLQKLAKNLLQEHRIKSIYEIPICTGCCDKLYSYRKGDFEERILTFAWFE